MIGNEDLAYIPWSKYYDGSPLYALTWCKPYNLVKALDSVSSGWAGIEFTDAVFPTPVIAHKDLSPWTSHATIGVAGTNTDHNLQYLVKGGTVATLEHSSNHCQAIGYKFTGTVANDRAIDLANSYLYNHATPTVPTVDWHNRYLNTAGNTGNWTVKETTSHFLIEGTEPATFGTLATGALQVAGGASFGDATQVLSAIYRAHFLHAIGAAVFANADPFASTCNRVGLVDDNAGKVLAYFYHGHDGASAHIRFIDVDANPPAYIAKFEAPGPLGSVDILTPTYGIDVQAGGIGSGLINASVGYYSAGHAGKSETSGDYCLVHKTTGAMLPVFLRGGVLCVD